MKRQNDCRNDNIKSLHAKLTKLFKKSAIHFHFPEGIVFFGLPEANIESSISRTISCLLPVAVLVKMQSSKNGPETVQHNIISISLSLTVESFKDLKKNELRKLGRSNIVKGENFPL